MAWRLAPANRRPPTADRRPPTADRLLAPPCKSFWDLIGSGSPIHILSESIFYNPADFAGLPVQRASYAAAVHSRRHVGIAFRRFYILMPQQFLDGPQIRAPLQ